MIDGPNGKVTQRIEAKLGEVRLRLGDTLLVLADPGFRSRYREGRDFLLRRPFSIHEASRRSNAW